MEKYISRENPNQAPCKICKELIEYDGICERSQCEYSKLNICFNCCLACDSCKRYLCINCIAECSKCTNNQCEDCMPSCDYCNDMYCEECTEEHSCGKIGNNQKSK